MRRSNNSSNEGSHRIQRENVDDILKWKIEIKRKLEGNQLRPISYPKTKTWTQASKPVFRNLVCIDLPLVQEHIQSPTVHKKRFEVFRLRAEVAASRIQHVFRNYILVLNGVEKPQELLSNNSSMIDDRHELEIEPPALIQPQTEDHEDRIEVLEAKNYMLEQKLCDIIRRMEEKDSYFESQLSYLIHLTRNLVDTDLNVEVDERLRSSQRNGAIMFKSSLQNTSDENEDNESIVTVQSVIRGRAARKKARDVRAIRKDVQRIISGWTQHYDPLLQQDYFFNHATEESAWELPEGEKLAWPIWSKCLDHNTSTYYYLNNYTSAKQETCPANVDFESDETPSPLLNFVFRLQNIFRKRKAAQKEDSTGGAAQINTTWKIFHDEETDCDFYFNTITNKSHWTKPAELKDSLWNHDIASQEGYVEEIELNDSHESQLDDTKQGDLLRDKAQTHDVNDFNDQVDVIHLTQEVAEDPPSAQILSEELSYSSQLKEKSLQHDIPVEETVGSALQSESSDNIFADLNLELNGDVFGDLDTMDQLFASHQSEDSTLSVESLQKNSAVPSDVDPFETLMMNDGIGELESHFFSPLPDSPHESPPNLLQRRLSSKLLIHTEKSDDSHQSVEFSPKQITASSIWGVLNSRATPTGRQVGEWAERVDTESGEVYYFNASNGECRWDAPKDFERRSGVNNPVKCDVWEDVVAPNGVKLFIYNWGTGEVKWSSQDIVEGKKSVKFIIPSTPKNNSIQTQRMWNIIANFSKAVKFCGCWIKYEESHSGASFYMEEASDHYQWEVPDIWNEESAQLPKPNKHPSFAGAAKAVLMTQMMSSKNSLQRKWSCVVAPNGKCLFEYNWETGDTRKSLNVYSKFVEVSRRYLLQSTEEPVTGASTLLWKLLKERAVETGRGNAEWKEYFDEPSRNLLYEHLSGSKWQWEKPDDLELVAVEIVEEERKEANSFVLSPGETPDGSKSRFRVLSPKGKQLFDFDL